MLNIYRTSSRAIKSVNSNVPFSALNVAEYLRSCIFEHLRKKGALCTLSFRVVHAQSRTYSTLEELGEQMKS